MPFVLASISVAFSQRNVNWNGNKLQELEIMEKVGNLISWIEEKHPTDSPNNIKIAIISNEDLDHWIRYFGASRVFLGEKIRSNQTTKASLIIFPVHSNLFSKSFHIAPANGRIETWIRTYGNRRRDHFIFVGRKIFLEQLWKVRKVNQLRKKWGYATDTEEFACRVEGDPWNPGFHKELDKLPADLILVGSNVRGRHFRISGWAHVPPYQYIKSTDDKGNMEFDGSHVRMFHEAAHYFNFTYYSRSADEANSYGKLLDNGSWTGMIGDVVTDEKNYDMTAYIGAFLLWYEMFDFVGTLSPAAVLFLTAEPQIELQWQAFLYPFGIEVWFSIIVLFLTVIGTMVFLLNSNSFQKLSKSIMSSSTLLTYQIAMEQTSRIPKGVKIISGAWLLFTIIIGTAYKSKVMSSLTFPFIDKPPQTYAELANSDYQPILNNIGGLEYEYFQSDDSQLIVQIAKKLKFSPNPIECIGQSVLNPKTVCIGWCPFLKYTTAEWASPDAKTNAVFIATSDPVLAVAVSLAFQKHSSYSEGFQQIIMSFFEAGIYTIWEDDVLRIHKKKGVSNYESSPTKPLNQKLMSIIENLTGGNGNKPLKISNLQIVFVILFIGSWLAIGAFISEHIFINVQKRWFTRTGSDEVKVIAVESLIHAPGTPKFN